VGVFTPRFPPNFYPLPFKKLIYIIAKKHNNKKLNIKKDKKKDK